MKRKKVSKLLFVPGLILALGALLVSFPPTSIAQTITPILSLEWSSSEGDWTAAIAWGDVDNDSDLDLAIVNGGRQVDQPHRLYRNDGGTLTGSAVWSSAEIDRSVDVAWGDVDNDGDLDLAVGNIGAQPNQLYRNDTPHPAKGKIAFSSDRAGNQDIYIMAADGSNLINLTNHPADELFPAWSPDGSRIAFSSDRDGNEEIYVIDADGTNLTRLTTQSNIDRDPAWSPDGNRIAFTSRREGDEEIYVMNADGSAQIRLTFLPGEDRTPTWSPDGNRIAFGHFDVWVMDADGGNLTRLTSHPRLDRHPAWSPAGDQIAFVTDRDGSGNIEIYVMAADGSNQTRLTNAPGYDHSPAWSPDGSQITFTSQRDGNNEIYTMAADGSNQVNLTNNAAQDRWPDWQPNLSTNKPPIANAAGPYQADEGHTLSLDGSASFDPNPGDSLTYTWDLDYDGLTFDVEATGVQPSLSFSDNIAARTIALQVTDPGGLTDLATTTLTINNVAPDVTLLGRPEAQIGETLSYTVTVSDPGSDTFSLQNVACGGKGDLTNIIFDSATGAGNFDCTFTGPGSSDVSLTVADDDGGVGNAALPVVITGEPSVITLLTFGAVLEGDHVRLNWTTGVEIDNLGFNLWRKAADDRGAVKINAALILTKGNPLSGARYTYLDTGPTPGKSYLYQLEDIDIHGLSTFHDLTDPASGQVTVTLWDSYNWRYLPLVIR